MNTGIRYDFEYLRNIPIRDVAELLGLEIDSRNRFTCPCHNDHHPSANLYEKNNSWRCFACNAGGSPIDLVMGVKDCTVRQAAKFLARYYPEAVLSKEGTETMMARPLLPTSFYHSIGFVKNPYSFAASKIRYVDETKAMSLEAWERRRIGAALYREVQMDVEEWVITNMVIDKIMDKQEDLIAYGRDRQRKYALEQMEKAIEADPEISEEACRTIYREAMDSCEEWKVCREQFQALGVIKNQFLDYYQSLENTVAEKDRRAYLGDGEDELEAEISPKRDSEPEFIEER